MAVEALSDDRRICSLEARALILSKARADFDRATAERQAETASRIAQRAPAPQRLAELLCDDAASRRAARLALPLVVEHPQPYLIPELEVSLQLADARQAVISVANQPAQTTIPASHAGMMSV